MVPLDGLIAAQVAALVREWGVTEQEAAEAVDRLMTRERRIGPEMTRATAGWDVYPPAPRQSVVIDLTDKVIDLTEPTEAHL